MCLGVLIVRALFLQKVSEYEQEMPQSQTADQPTELCGRATGFLQKQDIHKTIKAKQPALSTSSRR